MAKKPPARARYEASHPTVSFRVAKAEYAKLQGMRKKSGLSLGEMVRRVLEIRKKEVDEAYDRGFKAGYGRFATPCKVCGKPMNFDMKSEEDAKAAAAVKQTFSIWGHVPCLESRR
jgi:hypothetical protein